jgi:hypothetical protein
LIKWPNQRTGRTVRTPVELTDVHDAMVAPDAELGLPTRSEGAVLEDYVPHTAHNATDVMHWQAIATATEKYVRDDAGAQYLFDRRSDEPVRQPTPAAIEPHRRQLEERIGAFEAGAEHADGARSKTSVGSGVEAQLEDLGYLG